MDQSPLKRNEKCMEHLDLQVIKQGLQWLESGRQIWLCTVLTTFGSAPRGPGSMLVAVPSGENCGSLSGGCIEDDFLDRLKLGQFAAHNQIVRYGDGGLQPTMALPCGGVLDVLVERFEPERSSIDHFRSLETALVGRDRLSRTINLKSGSRKTGPHGPTGRSVSRSGEDVTIILGPVRRLIVAGLSTVAEFCAEFALALGYEVIICDPHPERLIKASALLPNAKLIEVLPAVFIAQGGCHAATAVVALTHDPRLDDLTLMESVRTDAFYIGAMGSSKTSLKRMDRLERIAGLTTQDMQRISAPIGLHLGSKTPAEIAISVMADILRVGNGIDRAAL